MAREIVKIRIGLFFATALLAAPPQIAFKTHEIATGLKGGYQVVAIDVNHDGKIDLIALASGMTELVWFENPTWERHVIAGNLPHMINLAARDIVGDGIPEIVLAYEFANVAKKSVGIVAVLTHNGDPRQLWNVREIDRIPTSHRLRWMDLKGGPVVVNAPLTGAHSEPPDFREHVPLVFYRPGEWKRELIGEENEGVVHGITITGGQIMTASFGGIHVYQPGANGKWKRTEMTKGDPAPWPKSGSSDTAAGQTGKKRFVAAVEPWHGNQVVVYRKAGAVWKREVIDDQLVDGHTIVTADLDGDGNDEIIAGFRGMPRRLYIYRFDGKKWQRQTLDDAMGASACVAADLNGDGKPDLACIASSTQNLKWYENVSR